MLYSETELKKRLKSGCPVFYFYASDEALVRSAAAKAEKFLSEEAPDTTTLDGPTPSVEDIVLAAGSKESDNSHTDKSSLFMVLFIVFISLKSELF